MKKELLVNLMAVDKNEIPEKIKVIKSVMNPTMTQLAKTFKVSRQGLYNWAKGDYISEWSYSRVDIIYKVAVFLHKKKVDPTYVPKVKVRDNKTLMELIEAWETTGNFEYKCMNAAKQFCDNYTRDKNELKIVSKQLKTSKKK